MPIRSKAPNAIGKKKTSFSRSVRWQRLGKANHVRRIERPNATDRHHQHPAQKNPEGSPYARLRWRNPNKSSLHNVIQNRQQAQRLLQSYFLIERSAIKSTSNTKWWSRTGSNRRHPACKAGALPAELRPQFGLASSAGDDLHRQQHQMPCGKQEWWAWIDSNYRPHPYQGCALTT
jgi:hypothetical protein